MNGLGRIVEWPRIQRSYMGGFYYNYQFPEGSHALVPDEGVSSLAQLEFIM